MFEASDRDELMAGQPPASPAAIGDEVSGESAVSPDGTGMPAGDGDIPVSPFTAKTSSPGSKDRQVSEARRCLATTRLPLARMGRASRGRRVVHAFH